MWRGHQAAPRTIAPPPGSFPEHPAYHEHEHAQELCQALPGQEAADLDPALESYHGLTVDHGDGTLSLPATSCNCTGTRLLHI